MRRITTVLGGNGMAGEVMLVTASFMPTVGGSLLSLQVGGLHMAAPEQEGSRSPGSGERHAWRDRGLCGNTWLLCRNSARPFEELPGFILKKMEKDLNILLAKHQRR